MTSGRSGKTKKRNLKCTELHTICEWVIAIWAKINTEINHYVFYKCSISNTMDSSEDSEIYYDEIFNNKTDEAKESNPNMNSGDLDKV
ncbi:20790_t:CDS:1, partial [Gigaspora margarita]